MSDKNRLFVVWNECASVYVCWFSWYHSSCDIYLHTFHLNPSFLNGMECQWERSVFQLRCVCVCRMYVMVRNTNEIKCICPIDIEFFWFRLAILYFSINCVVIRTLREQSMLFNSHKCSKYRIYIKIRIRQRHWAVDRFMEALNSRLSFQR